MSHLLLTAAPTTDKAELLQLPPQAAMNISGLLSAFKSWLERGTEQNGLWRTLRFASATKLLAERMLLCCENLMHGPGSSTSRILQTRIGVGPDTKHCEDYFDTNT